MRKLPSSVKHAVGSSEMRTSSDKRPRLSLIICSRNDQWQGNSLWRLETALNYTARQAARLGRLEDVEIIVADWGSVEPLSQAVGLGSEAARIVRYLYFPPELAAEKQKNSPFAEVFALNAAARRSRGDYIGRIDQDTLVGRRFFEWFFSALESPSGSFALESTAMISNRRRIPYAFAVRCPRFGLVERYVDLFHKLLPCMQAPPVDRYWQCYIGILLMHRRLWEAAGGYDESFIYYGYMEFDFFLRLLKKFPGIDLGPLVRWDFYHLDHVEAWSVWRTVRRSLNPRRTPANPPEQFCPNGESWGLAEYDIPITSPPPGALQSLAGAGFGFSGAFKFAWITIASTISTFRCIIMEKRRPAAPSPVYK